MTMSLPSARKFILPLVALALIHLVVLMAGFVAPYDPATQNRAAQIVRPRVCIW